MLKCDSGFDRKLLLTVKPFHGDGIGVDVIFVNTKYLECLISECLNCTVYQTLLVTKNLTKIKSLHSLFEFEHVFDATAFLGTVAE